MRTDHGGFDAPQDEARLIKVMLPALARLGVMKTVGERETALRKAVARTEFSDRHWPEALVSKLVEAGVKESADAHVLALAALRDAVPDCLSRVVMEITPTHPLVGALTKGMGAASPEYVNQLKSGKIDSDQIFFRCALAHIFRRDTENVFQMFLVDAAARKFLKATKVTIGQFVQEVQGSPEDHPAPAEAWGYCLVLLGIKSHMGLYLTEPVEHVDAMLARIVPQVQEGLGTNDPDAVANALAAAGTARETLMSDRSKAGLFLACAARHLGSPYIAVYSRDDDEGTNTLIMELEAKSVEEARRVAMSETSLLVQRMLRQLEELSGASDPGHEGGLS